MERNHVTILAANVVGYSALMETDEAVLASQTGMEE
jgi:chromosome segregation ATPase